MAKTCWYCHQDTMDPHDFGDGQTGHKCSSCGATDTPLPMHDHRPMPVAQAPPVNLDDHASGSTRRRRKKLV